MLEVNRAAAVDEVKIAYFEKACDVHPDLCSPQDFDAAKRFRSLSEAFWVLSDSARKSLFDESGHCDLRDFSMDVILQTWLWDFAVEDVAGVDEMIAETLQCMSAEDRLDRLVEAGVLPVGQHVGERLRCELCGYQLRGHGAMRAHFAEQHREDAEHWADAALGHAKASFCDFMAAAAGCDVAFALPDGSTGRLQPRGPMPDIHRSVEDELERCLRDDDPCGFGAVAAALQVAPQEAREAIMLLRANSGPGIAAYLAPVDAAEPDVSASAAAAALAGSSARATGQRTRMAVAA